MIVADRKDVRELRDMLKDHDRVLLVGCGTCVTVCLAGGEREVGILGSALRILAVRRLFPGVPPVFLDYHHSPHGFSPFRVPCVDCGSPTEISAIWDRLTRASC